MASYIQCNAENTNMVYSLRGREHAHRLELSVYHSTEHRRLHFSPLKLFLCLRSHFEEPFLSTLSPLLFSHGMVKNDTGIEMFGNKMNTSKISRENGQNNKNDYRLCKSISL